MKKLLVLLVSIANVICAYGQNADLEIESEIRRLEQKENLAMLNHDAGVLKSIWAPDFTVNTPFNRVTLSSAELLDMVKNGTLRFTSFTRNIEKIMSKQEMAITMGSEEVVFVGEVPHGEQKIKRRFTNIWLKQNGVWRLTARHANDICQK